MRRIGKAALAIHVAARIGAHAVPRAEAVNPPDELQPDRLVALHPPYGSRSGPNRAKGGRVARDSTADLTRQAKENQTGRHRGQRPAGWRVLQIPRRRRSRAGLADGSGRAGVIDSERIGRLIPVDVLLVAHAGGTPC